MQLSETSKKILVDEFRVIASLMNEEDDKLRKTFYFSAAYGVVHRILNIEYNDELILIHSVLNNTYTALDGRLKSIISGAERVIELPQNTFEVLSQSLLSLGDAIFKNQDIYQPLRIISAIGYITTGNGYFLYKKGILKL